MGRDETYHGVLFKLVCQLHCICQGALGSTRHTHNIGLVPVTAARAFALLIKGPEVRIQRETYSSHRGGFVRVLVGQTLLGRWGGGSGLYFFPGSLSLRANEISTSSGPENQVQTRIPVWKCESTYMGMLAGYLGGVVRGVHDPNSADSE